MSATRRRFLVVMGLGALGAATAWVRRDAVLRWLFMAPLPRSGVGALDERTLEVLRATVLTLLEDRVDPGHYLETFRWHAEHVRGAREVYLRYAAAVDARAQRAGHPGFRNAPREVRARILAHLQLPHGAAQRLQRAFLARDDDRFAHHVVRQVFRRFAHTDAFLFAGFGAWQGQPRALVRIAPPEASS